MNIGSRLSSIQKVIFGTIILGLTGSILLMFDGIQNIIIFFVENNVLGRPLDNRNNGYIFLQAVAFLGVFSCFLLAAVVLYYRQLVSVADSFLNKILMKQVFGTTVKEILVRQPFLLIFFLFVLYLIKNTFLVLNIIGFDRLVIILTLLIHIPVSLFMYSKRDKSIIPILICYFILVFSVLVNSFIFDYSGDGQEYHQVAAIQLNNGWNPFYAYLPEDGWAYLWNNHYPKFTEMFASILLSAFNNIELGKSYNMIFFIIVNIYALKYANKFQKNKLIVTAIAIIFSANPVVLAQFFTYYVDGVMGMLVVILIFACMEYEQSQNITDLLIITAVSVFLINTKFTGFISGFVLIAYIIKQLIAKEYKTMLVFICAGAAILMIGVGFTGYNPYITNTRDFGHPFHPLFGNKAIGYISNIANDELTFEGFSSMPSVQKFLSLFFLDYSIKNIPFNPLKIISLVSIADYGTIIGGFGIFFLEICVLLFLVLFIAIKNKDIVNYKKLLFPMIILLFIAVIMPANWWARYISFFWYLPGFLAMAGDYKSRLNKRIFLLCFTIIIINGGTFLFFNTFAGIKYSLGFKSFLSEIEASGHDTIHIAAKDSEVLSYSIAEKFRYYNIHKNIVFIEDEDAKFSNGVSFSKIKGWY